MLQVAAYCRVSTDKEDQANSFEAQQRYFRDYIERQPDWVLQLCRRGHLRHVHPQARGVQ